MREGPLTFVVVVSAESWRSLRLAAAVFAPGAFFSGAGEAEDMADFWEDLGSSWDSSLWRFLPFLVPFFFFFSSSSAAFSSSYWRRFSSQGLSPLAIASTRSLWSSGLHCSQ